MRDAVAWWASMTSMLTGASDAPIRRLVRLRGTVQGVGFRPHVHRLAKALGLVGTVCNDDDGVLVDVAGAALHVQQFVDRVVQEAPAAAQVTSVEVTVATAGPTSAGDFVIAASVPRGDGAVPVTPDLATCESCRREFHDPADRRHQYPFLNCTQCGPRYTIVRDVPYDRPHTTMAGFPMCADCRREYDAVGDRRFHAQPVACPACGPRLAWRANPDAPADRDGDHASDPRAEAEPCVAGDAVRAARAALAAGAIIAVKGLGGYHLLCDAQRDDVVQRLRARKQRPHQALAVLVPDLETARRIAHVSAEAAALLSSPAAPIVLVPRRADAPLSTAIAPDVHDVGLLLPYTPLHLLLAAHGPLVCTSANLSQEPIVWRDEEALERLAPLVDGWLWHDRPIAVPCDDSVWHADAAGDAQVVRRSRGYAPSPVALRGARAASRAREAVLAVGAELKSTLAVARDDAVYLSGHLGDVGDPLTLDAMALHADHLLRLFGVRPTRVACDAHPGYLSSRWARTWADAHAVPVVLVQHHHAHLVALQAEYRRPVDERLLAVTFDGTGYGPDGTIWGGEVLLGDAFGAERVARLRSLPLPGGDAGVREPSRLALAALQRVGLPWTDALPAVRHIAPADRHRLHTQLDRSLGVVETSSMGRLFDVCAALVGCVERVTYEGQAAIRLATLAAGAPATGGARYVLEVRDEGGQLVLDPEPLLAGLCDDAARTVSAAERARGVHDAVAVAVATLADRLRERHGPHPVGLTGGVFQNRMLAALTHAQLTMRGHVVRQHRVIPSNDGGLALGQAVIALVADPHHPPDVRP